MVFTIGIDFGGVLSGHSLPQDESQPVLEHINTAIDMPYAIESLQSLKSDGHALHIISYCGKKRARESLESLAKENLTYLFDTQNYVKTRMFKAQLCEYLGCDIMIDDRKDILDNIKSCLPHIHTIWFGTDQKHEIHHIAKTWLDMLKILSTLAPTSAIPNAALSISRCVHVL